MAKVKKLASKRPKGFPRVGEVYNYRCGPGWYGGVVLGYVEQDGQVMAKIDDDYVYDGVASIPLDEFRGMFESGMRELKNHKDKWPRVY